MGHDGYLSRGCPFKHACRFLLIDGRHISSVQAERNANNRVLINQACPLLDISGVKYVRHLIWNRGHVVAIQAEYGSKRCIGKLNRGEHLAAIQLKCGYGTIRAHNAQVTAASSKSYCQRRYQDPQWNHFTAAG